jgi:hypothetical protein
MASGSFSGSQQAFVLTLERLVPSRSVKILNTVKFNF